MLQKRIHKILFVIMIILAIPFIAMQFSNEVNWDMLDFIVAAVLLLVTGLGCELVLRKTKSKNIRIIICIAIVLILILVWMELAVGIFGSIFSGN